MTTTSGLGAPVCEPHRCRSCARPVTALGLHGLSCPKSAGRHPRHAHLNDVIRRSISSAGFPAVLGPAGLDRGDGRRPDGLTVFPFREGKCLTWDVTCVDTFADTTVVKSALEPGTAARQAEERKRQRYADLTERYLLARRPAATRLAASGGASPGAIPAGGPGDQRGVRSSRRLVCSGPGSPDHSPDWRAAGHGVAEAAAILSHRAR